MDVSLSSLRGCLILALPALSPPPWLLGFFATHQTALHPGLEIAVGRDNFSQIKSY